MGSVVELRPGDLERSGIKPETPEAKQRLTVYVCTRCNSPDQLFKLWSDGRITCGDCGVQMGNISVQAKPPTTRGAT